MRSADIQLRDSALVRVSQVKRWTIAAAAALTAGLAYMASALVPGKSLGAKARVPAQSQTTGSRSTTASSAAPPLPAAAGASQLGLEGPSQPPQSLPAPSQSAAPPAPTPSPSAAPPAAVSGGS